MIIPPNEFGYESPDVRKLSPDEITTLVTDWLKVDRPPFSGHIDEILILLESAIADLEAWRSDTDTQRVVSESFLTVTIVRGMLLCWLQQIEHLYNENKRRDLESALDELEQEGVAN